jgi:vitamin K-dependent gamma-carboxylase
LAHRISDDFSKRLGGPVEVRAEALVSLNGRAVSPMVDSRVDLARISDGLALYSWVLPAPTTRPPKVRPV